MQRYTAAVHCYILLLKGVHQFVLLHNNIFSMCPLEPQAPFPELHFLEYFELYLLTAVCTKKYTRNFVYKQCSQAAIHLICKWTILSKMPVLFFFILNCYLAAPWPTLGHCRGDSLTHPMLITAFYIFGPKVTGSLVTRLGP